MSGEAEKPSLNFIEQHIEEDIKTGKLQKTVHTRFPPEPNGYPHIGHAKSIVLNFGLAEKYGGKCNLRFDDTNPEKESTEYVEAIKKDIEWLGYQWHGNALFASDYFSQLYQWAQKLIRDSKAYVDDTPVEQIRSERGTPTQPGKESARRNRSVDENLTLFEEMRSGKHPDGAMVLRAKIDMTSPNMHMRDPILYRIRHVEHHRTGNEWCIYPTYDFAHGQSDSIEGITHSLCTLEFEVHRPLYDWLIEQLDIFPSKQTEFARLNLGYTVVSKRKLLQLVEGKFVNGWDDPRMPTLSGIRRRGYTPASIKNFVHKVGVARRDSLTDVALLEYSVREDLNKKANRVMGVLNPIKLTITNYPSEKEEMLSAVNNPEDESAGKREIPFSNEIYIERDDFMEDPPRKFFRLGPDREVRLKYAYIIKCEDYKKDGDGNVTEILCTYDPNSKSGQDTSGKKVKGTLSWVSAKHAASVEVRLYDRLFKTENMNEVEDDFLNHLNPDSLTILDDVKVEPSLVDAIPGHQFQFERQGYFIVDSDSNTDKKIFNRTVTLRDNWAKK
ncbi:MAG: glutamine--tRNA ligase/YqeY domain fusion protein [Bacteroidota bacterium]